MRIVILFIGILALASIGAVEAASWSATVKISYIEISNVNAPGTWLSFTAPPYSAHSCSVKNGQYKLGGGQANIDKMTEIATSALVNSRAVAVYWNGCSGGGTTGYPILLGIAVK